MSPSGGACATAPAVLGIQGRRTLLVTNDFPPRRGGIETFLASVCEAVPADDLVVYTSAMEGSGAVDRTLPYSVVRDRSAMLLPTSRLAHSVAQVALEHGCDAVVFGAAAPLGLLARGLRRRNGITHVAALTHGHEVWWATVPGFRHLLRRIAGDCDVVTYVSEYCRGRIAGALPAAHRSRLRRLSPPVDVDRFHPGMDGSRWRRRLGLGEAPVVLSASRLVRRKGQDVLIRAWPAVLARVPQARLVVLGDGPSRQRLDRLARRERVSQSVTFAPAVPWQEMPAVYAMADVFALPCRSRLGGLEVEAFGMVFQEAGASGLPLVVGDSGGAPEAALSTTAPTKAVVDGRDPAQVAAAMVDALTAAGGRPSAVSRPAAAG